MRKPLLSGCVVKTYVFACKVSTSGRDPLGKKRAVIIIPRKYVDELVGKRALVTVEVVEEGR